MKNHIHKFLDRKFTGIEAFMFIIVTVSMVSIISSFLGETFRYTMAGCFLLVGIYGFIRYYHTHQFFKKKQEFGENIQGIITPVSLKNRNRK